MLHVQGGRKGEAGELMALDPGQGPLFLSGGHHCVFGMGSETAEGNDTSGASQPEEDGITWKPSHRRAYTLIAVVLVTVLALGSLVVVYPYLTHENSGPAPVW